MSYHRLENKTGGGAKTTGWIGLHEYIVVFGKNKSSIKDISIPYSEKTASMYKGKDDNYETRGPFATWPLDTTSMAERKNLRYPITHKGKKFGRPSNGYGKRNEPIKPKRRFAGVQ